MPMCYGTCMTNTMTNQQTPQAEWLEGDPPPRRRGIGAESVWKPLLDVLKENPGRWAKVFTGSASKATSPLMFFKREGGESRSRSNDDKTVSVYARWPEG